MIPISRAMSWGGGRMLEGAQVRLRRMILRRVGQSSAMAARIPSGPVINSPMSFQFASSVRMGFRLTPRAIRVGAPSISVPTASLSGGKASGAKCQGSDAILGFDLSGAISLSS